MLKRDLFDILYGLPPIYSLTVENWDIIKDEIQKSYNRTVPSARGFRYARMISFEYLTDDKQVQKTVFDNGCEIIVNFGKYRACKLVFKLFECVNIRVKTL